MASPSFAEPSVTLTRRDVEDIVVREMGGEADALPDWQPDTERVLSDTAGGNARLAVSRVLRRSHLGTGVRRWPDCKGPY